MNYILIISYFFPPCPQTASSRIFGFVKEFKKNGYYPIIVTRQWEKSINTPKKSLASIGEGIIHNVYEDYEEYLLPYKSSIRDWFFIRSEKSRFYSIVSKTLTLFNSFLNPIITKTIPYSNLYFVSKNIIEERKNQISNIFISANPYLLFKFGYKLNKKFNIPWIADYRDAWTTNSMAKNERLIFKFLYFFERYFEKKWVNSCLFFTTVSEIYVNNINEIINKKGITLFNGYTELQENNFLEKDEVDRVTILYSGSMYSNQPVEDFLESVQIINDFCDNKISVCFLGVGYNQIQKQRILNSKHYNSTYIELTDWVGKDILNKYIQNSDLLLLLSYQGFNGIPTSKIFEYLSTNKRILLYPSDNGILKEILSDSGNHYIIDSKSMLINFFKNLNHKQLPLKRNSNIEKYSTEYQVKLLIIEINSYNER